MRCYSSFYNTGARADEAAQVKIMDLLLVHSSRDHSLVEVRGKGNKLRRCPLWPQTVVEVSSLIASRPPNDHVFLNRCGQPITRFGIHTMIERYVSKNIGPYAFVSEQTGEPSYHSAHDGNSSSPRGGRHQHHPCLVGARLAQHHKCLRGSGSGNEGEGACNLRGPRCCSPKTLEGGRRTDAVPANPLNRNYVALGDRLCASRANTASQRHIAADATEEILCGGPHKISQIH